MVFQVWLLGRALRVHLCVDVHRLAVNSEAKKVLAWDNVENPNLPCFPSTVPSGFVEVSLN